MEGTSTNKIISTQGAKYILFTQSKPNKATYMKGKAVHQ